VTIPRISSYPVPAFAGMTQNRVQWKPEPRRAALLIHDMQEYFLGFYDRGAAPIASMLPNIARIAEACRAREIPVFYTAQPAAQSREERGLLNDMWGPGLTAAPEAHPIVSELAPQADDVVITKYRYSAFQRTDLLASLHARGRDQLIICGVYAHIGCLLTACDAFMNDVQPFLVSDGVADFSAREHELALRYVSERCGVTLDSALLLDALGPSTTRITRGSLRSDVAAALELPLEELQDEDNVFELGLDSIRLMSLVEALRAQGASVTFQELAECRSVNEMLARVSS
jgi:bifunctional isochorismate lyase/aryl carrier protein